MRGLLMLVPALSLALLGLLGLLALLALPPAAADNLAVSEIVVVPSRPEAGTVVEASFSVYWQGDTTAVEVVFSLNQREAKRWNVTLADNDTMNFSYSWTPGAGTVIIVVQGDPNATLAEETRDDNIVAYALEVEPARTTNPLWYVAAAGAVLVASAAGYVYARRTYLAADEEGGGAVDEGRADEGPADEAGGE